MAKSSPLSEARRALAADPTNTGLKLRLAVARSRVEGSGVFLEILKDRVLWQQSSEPHQDQAILEVGRRLGSDYKYFRTRLHQCAGLRHRIATFRHRKSGMELQLIPGGTQTMGEEQTGFRSRSPYEAVVAPILVGRYPIRQGEWDKIGGKDSRQFKEKQAPIDSVSWHDVSEWLVKAGGGLRLPTEDEWEFAARAGSGESRYWGRDLDDAYCWYRDNCESPQSVIRHARRGNAFGLVDVLGNVWEWCLNPFEDEGNRYPLRGACWFNYDRYIQVAYRFSHSADQRFPYVGARLVREIPD